MAFPGRNFQTLMGDFGTRLSAIQQPSDLITLMTYSISLLSAIRLSIEAGLFRRLAASSVPLSLSDLAQDMPHGPHSDDPETKSQREEFISRMLRAVVALKLVDQASPEMYQANELTVTMIDNGFEAGWIEMYDNTTGPNSTYAEQIQWVRDNGFVAPPNATDGAFQRARGIIGTPTFQHWAKEDPQPLENLSAWMSSQQRHRLNWDQWFPLGDLFKESERGDVFLVDVGGGLGHDLQAFAERTPNRRLRLVNEDLPSVIKQARGQGLDSRIELIEQDFFQPQAIKDAQIYYMHKIMHDWPDQDCITILSQLRDAMGTHSKIFINDAVLPDQYCPLLLAAFDWTMLLQLSGKERSESMWTRLISRIGGLRNQKFWVAPEVQGTGFGEGIVEVIRDVGDG